MRVAVIGGGISGLTAAWRAAATGAEVVLLEGRDVVGGALRRGEVAGVTVDLGAESMLARRPEAVALAREAGLADAIVHPATSTAAVWSRGALHPLPGGTLLGVPGEPERLRGLLTDEEVARAGAERGRPATPLAEDVDVASWVARRVGPAVVERLVEPLLGGVYAGRADRLSLQATLPAVWEIARRGGSLVDGVAAGLPPAPGPGVPPVPVFAGLRGGIAGLPVALAAGLAARGVTIRTGTTVRGLARTADGWRLALGTARRAGGAPDEVLDADAVIVAVPPAAAARLLAAEVPAAAAGLREISAASLALVTVAVPATTLDGVTGSGLLVPPVEGRTIKAATFSVNKWGWVREGAGGLAVLRMSLGRIGEEAVLQRDDADLVRLATADLGDALARSIEPVDTVVTRWGGALPQYDVGHVARISRVRAEVRRAGGLAVCGAAFDGVGIPACIAAAGRAVADLAVPAGTRSGRMTP